MISKLIHLLTDELNENYLIQQEKLDPSSFTVILGHHTQMQLIIVNSRRTI